MATLMICIKQHLSNIMKKLSNTEADFKKSVAYKKSVYFIFISSEIIRKLIHYEQTTCISHWNDVEMIVSTSFQRGIQVACL